MTRRFSLVVALCLAIAASTVARPAHAQDAQASAWIDEGIRLRTEHRDAEALERFQRAWASSRSPEARAQVALAEQALGQWVEAERDLAGALASASDPWVTRNRQPLDGALAEIRRHLGNLEVRSRTPGARVRVNAGEPIALPLSAPLRLVIGTARVEVLADGYVTSRRELEVRPGDDLLEAFDLVATEATPPAPPPAPPAVIVRPPPVDPPSPIRAWGIRLMVGGGVMLVAGAAMLGWREAAAVAFNADRVPRCGVDRLTGAVDGGPTCESLQGQAEVARALSITGFALGGALTAGGLALFLAAPSPRRRASLACAPGLLSLSCGATF